MMTYDSFEVIESKTHPGVRFVINRMSFGRRVGLMRLVRELAPRLECFRAGAGKSDEVEAGLLSAEIDQLYLHWGLKKVEGLEIDGQPAGPDSLLQAGPECLFLEALGHVKAACRLSESEAKN
jgi:hypothetical protein